MSSHCHPPLMPLLSCRCKPSCYHCRPLLTSSTPPTPLRVIASSPPHAVVLLVALKVALVPSLLSVARIFDTSHTLAYHHAVVLPRTAVLWSALVLLHTLKLLSPLAVCPLRLQNCASHCCPPSCHCPCAVVLPHAILMSLI